LNYRINKSILNVSPVVVTVSSLIEVEKMVEEAIEDKELPGKRISISCNSSGDGNLLTNSRDYLRVALNLSGCLLQVGVGFLPQLGIGRRIGATPYTVKAQPAGAAFAIWGMIYPLCIIYGIYQAMPGQLTSPLLRRIGFISATAFYETIQWALIAIFTGPKDENIRGYVLYEWILSLTLFCGIAAPLNYILYTLQDRDHNNSSSGGVTQKEYLCVVVPLSIFAAWTTLASFVNVGGALLVSGVANFDVTNSARKEQSPIFAAWVYSSQLSSSPTEVYCRLQAWLSGLMLGLPV
jgi:hypothetical protein